MHEWVEPRGGGGGVTHTSDGGRSERVIAPLRRKELGIRPVSSSEQ